MLSAVAIGVLSTALLLFFLLRFDDLRQENADLAEHFVPLVVASSSFASDIERLISEVPALGRAANDAARTSLSHRLFEQIDQISDDVDWLRTLRVDKGLVDQLARLLARIRANLIDMDNAVTCRCTGYARTLSRH